MRNPVSQAQIGSFVLKVKYHPPSSMAIPGMPGCVYETTPYDQYSCFWYVLA